MALNMQYINVSIDLEKLKEPDMFSNLKNLNQTWVIVSRHNGNVFFKRKDYITKVKNYPDTACLWYSEVDARKELERLNSTRKKCKYSIENASKYFVNSFEYTTWYNRIDNKAIPIKRVQTQKIKLGTPQTVSKAVIEHYKDKIAREQRDILHAQQAIVKYEAELLEKSTINFEAMLKPYETQGDRMVKVLFATKENTNEPT